MEKIVVYVDDAAYAQQQLVPMKRAGGSADAATHWIVVACAPRMTHRISKWVSHSARENWRAKWADKLFGQVMPMLRDGGDEATAVLAKGPLADLTQRLLAEHGASRVVDARRPKFGHDMEPVSGNQPAPSQSRWTVPGAVAGLGAMLVLAAE